MPHPHFKPEPTIKSWGADEAFENVAGWQLSLNPRATLSVQAHYEISWPSDMRIFGL